MRFHLFVGALAGALYASAATASLPDDAPDGKRWMSCFIKLKDTGDGYKRPIAVGGYWLIDVPDGTRKETEDRLKAQWLDEFVGRIPSEFPGFVADTYNGTVSDARCGSYSSRSEWAAFAAHVKEPVTYQGVLRSDFVPSFAEAWVSTREHARGFARLSREIEEARDELEGRRMVDQAKRLRRGSKHRWAGIGFVRRF